MKLIDLQEKCWIAVGTLYMNGWDSFKEKELYPEVKSGLSVKELEFYGKKVKMPRLTAWFGEGEYRYSGTINPATPMPNSVAFLRDHLEDQCLHLPGFDPKRRILNSVLLNFYRDGQDSVDWHSDDESQLGPTDDNVVIASLTCGHPRKFVLRHKENKQKISFELGDGDLLIMGGQTQKKWQHKVPKTSKKVGKRLNLTFRCFK